MFNNMYTSYITQERPKKIELKFFHDHLPRHSTNIGCGTENE